MAKPWVSLLFLFENGQAMGVFAFLLFSFAFLDFMAKIFIASYTQFTSQH
jgi:hypothetical protein